MKRYFPIFYYVIRKISYSENRNPQRRKQYLKTRDKVLL